MRYWSSLTLGIQAFQILILTLVAVYAFSNSFVFPSLVSALSNVFPVEPMYISVILAAFLIVVGSLQVIVRREPKTGFFIFLVVILLTPSVLTTTTIDWAQILGLELEVENELPWGIVLLFAVMIVFGYMALRFTASHNSLALVAADRGYDKQEVGTVYSAQHTWGFIIAGGAAIIGIVIFLILKAIERAPGSGLGGMSTSIIPLGILCSLGLIMTIYAVIIRGRAPATLSRRPEIEERQGSTAPAQTESSGTNWHSDTAVKPENTHSNGVARYVGDSMTRIYHVSGCSSLGLVEAEHIVRFKTREEAETAGYSACQDCRGETILP